MIVDGEPPLGLFVAEIINQIPAVLAPLSPDHWWMSVQPLTSPPYFALHVVVNGVTFEMRWRVHTDSSASGSVAVGKRLALLVDGTERAFS